MYCIDINHLEDDYNRITLTDKHGFCLSYSGFGNWAELTLLDEHSIDVRLPRFEIRTFTLCDGFVNTWKDNDDQPVTFATLAEARSELADFLWCTRHDSKNGVPMYSRDDFQIVKVTE